MGKRILLLLLLIASSACGLQKPVKKIKANEKAVLQLRGGDLGPIDGKTLATTFSVLASSDAICGALMPLTSMRWLGIYIVKDSLSHKYLHGIGASAATIAVANFLAVTGRTSVEQAIAFGFLARMVSMSFMILTNDEKVVGMTLPMFGVMWVTLAGIVYSLFANIGHAMDLTKVASMVLGLHGLYLYLKPDVILRRSSMFIGPDPYVKYILSIDGAYMLASAVTTGMLAYGENPIKVTGYTAICLLPVMFQFFEVNESKKAWGTLGELGALVVMGIMAAIIVGTLH